MNSLIARINELAAKQRAGGLNDAEKIEQATLRKRYIDLIKMQVKDQLENIKYTDETHGHDCDCCHKH